MVIEKAVALASSAVLLTLALICLGQQWEEEANLKLSYATAHYWQVKVENMYADYVPVVPGPSLESSAADQPLYPKVVIDGTSLHSETETWLHWACPKGYVLNQADMAFPHIARPTLNSDLPQCIKGNR